MPYKDVSKGKLHSVWRHARARCIDTTHYAYHQYGGRGISVCKEWDDFNNFYEWAVASGYKSGLTLDRIDNDGNYCPDNCRWATWKEQGNNRRTNTYITHNGRTQTLTAWANEIGLSKEALWRRLCVLKWSTEDALTIPKGAVTKHSRKEYMKHG